MKNFSIALGFLAAAASTVYGADGVDIAHLGTHNTLVRVEGDAPLLLLPVQESVDDARVIVLADGQPVSTFFVRLAQSKTDYTVPFDLTPYRGHNVILDIVTPQDRSSVREAKDDVCWGGIALTDTFDTSNRERRFRPAFHHTPLYGWMNDPNGMFYKDGVWHLYYQYNPYGSKWQNMTWGHSTSTNLTDWRHEAPALTPDGLGSIFSGSCAVDEENTAGFGEGSVVAMYTSAGTSQMQSLAWSDDNGKTFTKFAANPVITLDTEARDPNMFRNRETGEWNLVLAHALEREMLFFTSPDMKNWTLRSSFGKGLGAQGGVWECPDLFRLPVGDTGASKWVLICNINPGGPFGGSGIQYFTGQWDGTRFTPDTDAEGNVPTKWLDYGKDNYALVSWSDAPQGRRTVIGWMSNWQYAADVPTMQFRSANTLPREISLFEGSDGQVYAANAPSPEVDALRASRVLAKKGFRVGSGTKTFTLPGANDGICEITGRINAAGTDSLTMTLANASGEKLVMVYNPREHTLSVDRRASGIVDFSENFPAVTTAPTFETDGTISFRIFVDRASVEVFANEGRSVQTNLVFPTSPYTTLSLSAAGRAANVENLSVYSLKAQ